MPIEKLTNKVCFSPQQQAKWVTHWKDFFDKSHESKMQERRKSLMALNRITIAEIEEVMLKQKPADEVITLDDSSDEDNGNRDVADGQNNKRKNVSKSDDTMKSSSVDASLLSTLRLLASLDTGTFDEEDHLKQALWL